MEMATCPTCQKSCTQAPDLQQWLPFCCQRCRLIDLGRWLTESYGVPSLPRSQDDEEEANFQSQDADSVEE